MPIYLRMVLGIFSIYQKAVLVALLPLCRKKGRKVFVGCRDVANNFKFTKDVFGPEAITVSKSRHLFYDYTPDVRFPFYAHNGYPYELFKMIIAPFILLYCVWVCQIFIYFWNEAILLDRSFEFRMLKKKNKIIIVRYVGCDIRHWEPAFQELEYKGIFHVCSLCKEAFSERCNKKLKQKTAEESDKYADLIYSNVGMPSFIKRRYKTTRIPLDLQDYEYSFTCNSVPQIVHAPSNPILKGTPIVRLAIKKLEQEGYKFNYIEITHKRNKEVLRELIRSQIAIDQLGGCGTSLFALEAMACGNVVLGVANIEKNPTIPKECPIININPLKILDELKKTLDTPEKWRNLAERGREYVEKYHDKQIVGSQLKQDIFEIGISRL